MRNVQKTILVWIFFILIFFFMYTLLNPGSRGYKEITYSRFIKNLDSGEVVSFKIDDLTIKGALKDGSKFITHGIISEKRLDEALNKGVEIVFAKRERKGFWQSIFVTWLPMIFLMALFFMFMKQLQAGSGKALSFGKSRAKLIDGGKPLVTFDDVAGVDEAKQELQEVVEFLKNPRKFTKLGGELPRGVLLVGHPGTGKTLLAKAVAGEAGVPFFTISGSNFVEMFVGVGASRVRDLFEKAKRNAPCIIFIDEIDAVGRLRGAGLGGGHDEREQTLNQLLVEMDGFDANEGIIVLAATNRPDVLDPALLRAGRFDRRIIIPLPDVKGREAILKVHAKNKPLSDDVDLKKLAQGTPGLSGADLKNILNEAALLAARKGKDLIDNEDLEEAKDKILMGVEHKSKIISKRDREITAYHEAGHVIVAKNMPDADPIHKVSIIPRGMALGVTQQMPEEDRLNYSKEQIITQITILMGGRAAEEIAFDTETTGATNDFQKATDLARRMVCDWGMSDKMGHLTYQNRNEEVFLGRDFAVQKFYSEQTAREIDLEIKNIIENAYKTASHILLTNKQSLSKLAEALLEKEVLIDEEIEKILNESKAEPDSQDTETVSET